MFYVGEAVRLLDKDGWSTSFRNAVVYGEENLVIAADGGGRRLVYQEKVWRTDLEGLQSMGGESYIAKEAICLLATL